MVAGVQNRPLVIEGQRFMYTLTERVSDFCPDKVHKVVVCAGIFLGVISGLVVGPSLMFLGHEDVQIAGVGLTAGGAVLLGVCASCYINRKASEAAELMAGTDF